MCKLSKLDYEDNRILKGRLFIYMLTNFESRATIDVDFLLRSVSNSLEEMQALIVKILATPTGNDYIEMTAKGFDAIQKRFELTGRMKDFYNIYYLARTFDRARLQMTIARTLERHGTPYDKESFKNILTLADDTDMQKRWRYFLKNIKDNTLEFSTVIEEIKIFLEL